MVFKHECVQGRSGTAWVTGSMDLGVDDVWFSDDEDDDSDDSDEDSDRSIASSSRGAQTGAAGQKRGLHSSAKLEPVSTSMAAEMRTLCECKRMMTQTRPISSSIPHSIQRRSKMRWTCVCAWLSKTAA